MLRRSALKLFTLLALAVWPVVPAQTAEPDARIFAAASLVDVLDDLAAQFASDTGREVQIVAGSSSTLAWQINAGAPADLFISANKTYADDVAKKLGVDARALFGNALAIIAPEGFEASVTLAELSDALGEGRLAVGDPEHVPAGIYTEEALKAAGQWDALKDRLAPAGDVRGAVAFVARRAAPFGIVYATDARVAGIKIAGRVDDTLHDRIAYWAVLTNEDSETAALFESFIVSAKGLAIIEGHGFRTMTGADD